MFKRIVFTLLLFSSLFPTLLHAQIDYSIDSLRLVNAEWSIDTLEGFYLKRYQFGEGALFCSAQHLCIIEIPSRSHRRLAFACSDTMLTELSCLARQHNAYAAINGSQGMSAGGRVATDANTNINRQTSGKNNIIITCVSCKGSGICRYCNGSGYDKNTKSGKCTACHNTGRCKMCRGKGET